MNTALVLLILLAPNVSLADPGPREISPKGPQRPYTVENRVAYLHQALDVLTKLGPTERHALELELHTAARATCMVGTTRAAASCLTSVARSVCLRKPDCLAAADIMLTNEHAEHDLIDEATRMRLVRGSADYHAAIGAELWAIYAVLASELALSPPAPDLAAQIDAFCAGRDRTVHACEPDAKACLPSVPYQRCATGLVWFIGNQESRP